MKRKTFGEDSTVFASSVSGYFTNFEESGSTGGGASADRRTSDDTGFLGDRTIRALLWKC